MHQKGWGDLRYEDIIWGCCPPCMAGCTGFTEHHRQTDQHLQTQLWNVAGNRRGFPVPAVPRAHTCFFPSHIISAELSMQPDEVNQQLGISKVCTIRWSQVSYIPDYEKHPCTVSVFWCESIQITWIVHCWLISRSMFPVCSKEYLGSSFSHMWFQTMCKWNCCFCISASCLYN